MLETLLSSVSAAASFATNGFVGHVIACGSTPLKRTCALRGDLVMLLALERAATAATVCHRTPTSLLRRHAFGSR